MAQLIQSTGNSENLLFAKSIDKVCNQSSADIRALIQVSVFGEVVRLGSNRLFAWGCCVPEDDVAEHFFAKEVDQHIRFFKVFFCQCPDCLSNHHLPRFFALNNSTDELADFLDLLVAKSVARVD